MMKSHVIVIAATPVDVAKSVHLVISEIRYSRVAAIQRLYLNVTPMELKRLIVIGIVFVNQVFKVSIAINAPTVRSI